MQVQDHSQIKPPLAGPDVTDIARPFLVGSIRREVTIQKVWRDVERVVAVCGSAAIRARCALVRRRRPLGPSITSNRENPTPVEPSKWTPILPSFSKAKPSSSITGTKWPDQIGNGSRGRRSAYKQLGMVLSGKMAWVTSERVALTISTGKKTGASTAPCADPGA